jgi:hypothetical protein
VNATNKSPVKNQKVSVSGIGGKEEAQQEADRKLITKPTTPDLRFVTPTAKPILNSRNRYLPTFMFVLNYTTRIGIALALFAFPRKSGSRKDS